MTAHDAVPPGAPRISADGRPAVAVERRDHPHPAEPHRTLLARFRRAPVGMFVV